MKFVGTDAKEKIIKVIYVVLFAVFVFKMFFYINEDFGTPDALAQMSYATYMELHPDIWVPDFADVPMYKLESAIRENGQTIYMVEDNGGACYLGHPTFYYKLLALFDHVSVDIEGNIFVNYTKIRITNLLLTALTMVLILVTGWKLLKKKDYDWQYHLLFGAIVTSLPLYAYVGSGVNNDNLCNLGLVIVWIGLINYLERGYCYKTFWLVCGGLVITVLSKLSAGLIVVLAVAIMILVDVIKTRKLGIIFNKYFASTLPLYIAPLHYFLSVYVRYKSFQPAYSQYDIDGYKNSGFYVEPGVGEKISFGDDIVHYFGGVWETWSATYNSSYMLMREGVWSMVYAVVLILFVGSMVYELVSFVQQKGKRNNMIVFAFGVAVIGFLFSHFMAHYRVHSAGGYSGGTQGRYYMSVLPIIAIGATEMMSMIFEKGEKYRRLIGQWCSILIAFGLIYLDFFYFIFSLDKILY